MSSALLAFLLQLTALIADTGQSATLLFAGDAMMHQAQIDDARQPDGSFDFDACFEFVKPAVTAADFAVVNLETPLAGRPYTGYPCFSAPDSYAAALRDTGFDLFLTANNHILDKRDRGLRRTLAALDSLGVGYIGTYSSRAERDSVLPVVVDVKGFRIGFLNYTYGTNGIMPTTGTVVDYIDRDCMARDIAAARMAGAELVAVCVHWGVEYELLPQRSVRELADWLEEQGVDMIIGGHPHVVQPMELRACRLPDPQLAGDSLDVKRFRCYSLGNFLSNMRTTDTRGGCMVRVVLKRDSRGHARVDDAEYMLVFTAPGRGTRFAVHPAEAQMPAGWGAKRDAFVRNAVRLFDSHNVAVPRDSVSRQL